MICLTCGEVHESGSAGCGPLEEATRFEPALVRALQQTPARPRSDGFMVGPTVTGERGPDATSRVPLSAPESEDLEPGMMVGEYRIESWLGEGGMGAVYRAIHPVIAKRAVVKVIKASLGTGHEIVERFIREARAVNQIAHPNIVDVFSFGLLPDGRPYLVMEWLQGESLATRLDYGRVPIVEGAEILLQMCNALEAAHTRGVIHRDLKPDNVYLVATPNDERPLVKLLDFGLAKLIEPKDDLFLRGSQVGVLIGTPAYISPEQARCTVVDHRTDIYALGVIAFEILTGRPPLDGHTAMDLIIQHITAEPPMAHTIAPEVPVDLSDVLHRMMAKEPSQRPALSQLRSILASVRALGSPAATAQRAGTPEGEEEPTGVVTSAFFSKSALKAADAWDRPDETAGPVHGAAQPDEAPTAIQSPGRLVPETPMQVRTDSARSEPLPLRSPSIIDLSAVVAAAVARHDDTVTEPHQRISEEPISGGLSQPLFIDLPALEPDVADRGWTGSARTELDAQPWKGAQFIHQTDEVAAAQPRTAGTSTLTRLSSRLLGDEPRRWLRANPAAVAATGAAALLALSLVTLAMVRSRTPSAQNGGTAQATSHEGQVRLEVRGLPPVSQLLWNKRPLKSNPAWVERSDETYTLEITSEGYSPISIELQPREDLSFSVTMLRGGAPAPSH